MKFWEKTSEKYSSLLKIKKNQFQNEDSQGHKNLLFCAWLFIWNKQYLHLLLNLLYN